MNAYWENVVQALVFVGTFVGGVMALIAVMFSLAPPRGIPPIPLRIAVPMLVIGTAMAIMLGAAFEPLGMG